MKGFVGQKRRNYRRRHCSQLADNDDNDDEDGNDSNENSNAGGDGDQKPFCEIRTPNVIVVETRADVDGAGGANSTSGLGEEQAGVDGVLPDPSVASSTKGGDGGQNGTRIASGIGFHMLRAMGWTENTGLGQSRKGMVDPILPTSKAGNLGIGFNATSVYDTQQEAIRRIQKAKRDERDRKLKLKLEKAQEAEEEEVFMRESYLAASTNSDGQPLESTSTYVEGATDAHSSKMPLPLSGSGLRPTEIGQCPHCGQRFETKQGLKSHIQARHAKLLQATKRQFKKERRRNGAGKQSGRRGAARALAPMKQDFSVYD